MARCTAAVTFVVPVLSMPLYSMMLVPSTFCAGFSAKMKSFAVSFSRTRYWPVSGSRKRAVRPSTEGSMPRLRGLTSAEAISAGNVTVNSAAPSGAQVT